MRGKGRTGEKGCERHGAGGERGDGSRTKGHGKGRGNEDEKGEEPPREGKRGEGEQEEGGRSLPPQPPAPAHRPWHLKKLE